VLSEPTIGGSTDASEDGVKRGEGWKQVRNLDAGLQLTMVARLRGKSEAAPMYGEFVFFIHHCHCRLCCWSILVLLV